MDVTAVVVTWNSEPDIVSCLRTLPSDVPVLVVDNASADASASAARRHGATVRVAPRNIGFAAAVNSVLPEVTTESTLLLNPDVSLDTETIPRLRDALAAAPDVGIVGPSTRLPNGSPEPPAARRDRTAAQIVIESLGLVHLSRRFDRQMIHDRTVDRDVDAVNGACLLIRTELLRSLGGLDESVFLYLEDQDLCRRVREAGYRIRFVADAHATHGNGTSTARGTCQQRDRAYLNRIDADLEFLRRYGQRGEVGIAIAAFALRAVIGLLGSVAWPGRRSRYRAALGFTLRQLAGRRAAPPV